MAVDATATYDPANIFARILRGDIANRTVHESAHALAFHDIAPLAPIHVLVIPKGAYVSMADFCARATPAEITDFWRAASAVIEQLDLAPRGFRILSNAGRDAGQEVPHMHVHIFAGTPLGPMLASSALASPAPAAAPNRQQAGV